MSRFPWAWLGSLREWMKIKGKGECALPGGIVKLRLLSPVIWYRSSGEGLRTCIYYKFPSDADASGRGSQAENHWHGSVPSVQLSSVSQSCLTLRPHGLQHARPPCPSWTSRVYSDSCPLSRWCHPTISPSVVPFSSHFQSFPASGKWVSSSHQVAKGLEFQLQHQSFQWIFRTDFL